MDLKKLLDDADEEKENGRSLGDEEYSNVLKNRPDIFLVEKETRLLAIESVSLALCVVFGIWLTSAHTIRIAPEFYRNIMRERSARLLRKMTRPPQRVSMSQKTPAGIQTGSLSITEYGLANTKENPELSREKKVKNSLSNTVKKGTAGEPGTLSGPGKSENAGDETRLINIANANKTRGNRSDAFSSFRRVLKRDPHNVAALAGMGDLFLYTGDLDSAVSFYAAANAQNPRIASVHNGLGSAHYYLSVMAANPNFTNMRNISDSKRYLQSQYDSAVIEYTNAISLDSSRVDALTNRGVIRDNRGDHSGALEDYTRAIRINPLYAEAYGKRAAAYKASGRFNDALADYTAAIKLDTGSYEFDPRLHFANAYFGRGNVEFQLGKYDKAIADFDTVLVLSPYHSLAMVNKARALVNVNQVDSAIVWYTKAIATLSPAEYGGAQERAFFGRGVAYNIINQPALALQDFNRAIKLKPEDPYSYFHRGNAFKALARFDEAIADYTAAAGFHMLAAKSCWRIAECYALKQDKANAAMWLKKSVSKGFTNIQVWKRDQDLKLLWHDREFLDLTKNL